MNDFVIFALLFVAIAIGWFLGRRGGGNVVAAPELPSQYYKGLNYILDDHPDGAIDAFIDALEVNSETLETHIALGNLLRRRGEVDRAIRIHQNLLARPSLPRVQVHQAHLELSRDYISAGLLDRAERLLLDLKEESPEQRRAARQHLLEIYQSERDWERAVDVARELLPRKKLLGGGASKNGELGQDVSVVLSHYYCEMAAQKCAQGEVQAGRGFLNDALSQDRNCVRASLMLGDLEFEAGHFKQAVKALRQVRQQDADYVPETIAVLRQCYSELGDDRELKSYLQACLDTVPSTSLVLAVAEDMRQTQGDAAARDFLAERLAARPSLRGLSQFITLQIAASESEETDDLGLVQRLVSRLISERPAYRCSHCGFAGIHLHWFCPGCKYWGTMKAIRSAPAE